MNSIFFQQSHIALIEPYSEYANENSRDLLEKNLPVAQTLLFGQSANLVHSFSACHGKKNEVYTNWHIRLFSALYDGRERSTSPFRRVNGLYSRWANQLGPRWAARGHGQQENISHSPFNLHMPPRHSTVAIVQREIKLGSSFVRSFYYPQ